MSSPAPASTIHILDLRTWKRAEVALVLGYAAANQKLLCKTSACGRTREHPPRSAQLKSKVLESTELDIYPSGRLHGRSSCGKTELLWQGESWLHHHLHHRMFQTCTTGRKFNWHHKFAPTHWWFHRKALLDHGLSFHKATACWLRQPRRHLK